MDYGPTVDLASKNMIGNIGIRQNIKEINVNRLILKKLRNEIVNIFGNI